jgi:hypothetical protein
MKNNFLNKCVFYSFQGSNILMDLEKLYPNYITNHIIDDSFNYNRIDELKTNILVLTWSRFFPEYYNEPLEKRDHFKQGFGFTKKFFDIVAKLSNKGVYFVIDNVMEADTFITPELVFFLEKLKKIGVEQEKILWVYNNSSDINGKIVNIRDFKINTLHFPHFFISTLFELPEPTNKPLEKQKDFLILNRRFGLDKYRLLKQISDRGLLDNSIYTILQILPELAEINQFEQRGLPNDIADINDVVKDDTYLYKLNTDVFFKTKVNIIAETFLFYKENDRFNDIVHITEKTWKAIYMGVPFVVSATNNHIETLHQFGFKTFNEVINEDYDLENDVDIKVNKVIDSAVELGKKYNNKKVLDIIEYNSNLFKNIEHKKTIVETFFLKPFEKLVRKQSSLI